MKVCVYLRMARAEKPDEKKISPEMQSQFDKIKEFIESQNHTISAVKFDYGSGMDYSRASLREMLKAPITEYEGVIVKDISRIGRNPTKTIRWVDRLNTSGKKLISVEEGNIDFKSQFGIYKRG